MTNFSHRPEDIDLGLKLRKMIFYSVEYSDQ